MTVRRCDSVAMGEWGNGEMGEWENGEMGEWENGKVRKSGIRN